MTFDKTTLIVGSKFYGVRERNTFIHRRKLHQVIDGEDWFKYSDPLREFDPVDYDVVGIMDTTVTVEGQWPSDHDRLPQREFYVWEYCRKWMEQMVIEFNDHDVYFHTVEERNQNIVELEAKWHTHELSDTHPKDDQHG
jgi:hypothetical protein